MMVAEPASGLQAAERPAPKACGAQGRNRTTDTAIFSRMLYQLSYLGIPRGLTTTIGRAGYSGVRRSCLPRFALGFAWRGPAPGAIIANPGSPEAGDGLPS